MSLREFLAKFEFYDSNHDFIYGVLMALILVVLLKILFWSLSSNKCTGISLLGPHGTLFISAHAIEDFVIRTLADKEDMVIDKVVLNSLKESYSVTITMRVAAEANVNDLRPSIEDRILRQTASKLGIESIKTINLIVKNFSVNEKQIVKRQKMALKQFTQPEPESLERIPREIL
jgi:hypothetical protein